MMLNEDVAEKLDIHPVSLSRLRSGDRKPSMEMISKIEKMLSWDVEVQFRLLNDPKKPNLWAAEFRQQLKEKYGIPDIHAGDTPRGRIKRS